MKKTEERDSIVSRAVKEGKVDIKINREKQLRHTKEEHMPGRSYIDGDLQYAQKLVDKLGGTGNAVIDKNGNWTNKEKVEDSSVIGIHVDNLSGKETKTNKGMIVYSKSGTHIYPRKGE